MAKYIHNPDAPHQAVILIRAEIMEMNQIGQVIGIPVKRKSKLLSVTGNNMSECIVNLQQLFERMGIKCQVQE